MLLSVHWLIIVLHYHVKIGHNIHCIEVHWRYTSQNENMLQHSFVFYGPTLSVYWCLNVMHHLISSKLYWLYIDYLSITNLFLLKYYIWLFFLIRKRTLFYNFCIISYYILCHATFNDDAYINTMHVMYSVLSMAYLVVYNYMTLYTWVFTNAI